MTNNTDSAWNRFIRDKNGKIVTWQRPNLPLTGWIICKLLAMVIPAGHLQTGSARLSTALIFVWAYLELTSGVNYFRKLLGLIVLAVTISGFFA